jgi:hypothetical protein
MGNNDVLLEEEKGGESLNAELLSDIFILGGIYLGDVVRRGILS